MVARDEAIVMLVEGLQFEEIHVTNKVQMFLTKLRRSDIDERVKAEIEKKASHLLEETLEHSKTLTELLKEVAGGSQIEY